VSVFVPMALMTMAAVLIAMSVYGFGWFPRHNVPHMRSVTPVCPNCDTPIRATLQNHPDPRARLRDHFKECVA